MTRSEGGDVHYETCRSLFCPCLLEGQAELAEARARIVSLENSLKASNDVVRRRGDPEANYAGVPYEKMTEKQRAKFARDYGTAARGTQGN